MRRSFRAAIAQAAVVVFLAGLLSACSSNDGGAAATGTAESPATGTVEVTATEYAFDVPAEVAGGVVEFRFVNDGEAPHDFGLARVEGASVSDVEETLASGVQSPMEDVAGGAGLSPEQSATVTLSLEPGTYVFTCHFPNPEGRSHLALGMFNAFTVGEASDQANPSSDAVIAVTDGETAPRGPRADDRDR
jgi:hypothetical protein